MFTSPCSTWEYMEKCFRIRVGKSVFPRVGCYLFLLLRHVMLLYSVSEVHECLVSMPVLRLWVSAYVNSNGLVHHRSDTRNLWPCKHWREQSFVFVALSLFIIDLLFHGSTVFHLRVELQVRWQLLPTPADSCRLHWSGKVCILSLVQEKGTAMKMSKVLIITWLWWSFCCLAGFCLMVETPRYCFGNNDHRPAGGLWLLRKCQQKYNHHCLQIE